MRARLTGSPPGEARRSAGAAAPVISLDLRGNATGCIGLGQQGLVQSKVGGDRLVIPGLPAVRRARWRVRTTLRS
jgi:hypothetical protein